MVQRMLREIGTVTRRCTHLAALAGLACAAAAHAQTPPRVLGTPAPRPVLPDPSAIGLTFWREAAAMRARCGFTAPDSLGRDPLPGELRCAYDVFGPGRFGLLSYLDVPVYQPRTTMPGTHVVGVPGLPAPLRAESYEHWEWRMLRASFGPEAAVVRRDLETLDPVVAAKILRFEQRLAAERVPARRREAWRAPERQAWLFQQGRVRPGPLATATLTSWHCRLDRLGRPAGRAVDYDVPPRSLPRFHEIAEEVGLLSFGADSNDPGHVFYAGAELLRPTEIAVLRMLPRVPYVTLATGRSVDEAAGATPLPELQRLTRAFAALPFEPVPLLRPARSPSSALRALRVTSIVTRR